MQPKYRLRTERSLRVFLVSGGQEVGLIEGDYPPWEYGAFKINTLYFRDEFFDTKIIVDALQKLFDETAADRADRRRFHGVFAGSVQPAMMRAASALSDRDRAFGKTHTAPVQRLFPEHELFLREPESFR